jgi:hypothetical protein
MEHTDSHTTISKAWPSIAVMQVLLQCMHIHMVHVCAPFRHSLGSNARMGGASGGTAGTLPPVPGHSTATALATEQMQMERRHIVVQQRQLDPGQYHMQQAKATKSVRPYELVRPRIGLYELVAEIALK